MSEAGRDAARESWRPGTTLGNLRRVAALRADVRAWMGDRDVLEVVTPVLSAAAPADFHLDAFRATGPLEGLPEGVAGNAAQDAIGTPGAPRRPLWLQTSPEYPMKRLLAAHGVDVYQIAPVFRADERGRRHNPEFTMLEWYRVGMDHVALMDDVADLLEALWRRAGRPWLAPERRSCHEVVDAVLGDGAGARDAGTPFVDVARVRRHFEREGRSWPDAIGDDPDAALDLLLDEFVLPALPADRLTFLHGWPPSQAALARIATDARGRAVAERFELYVGALELGNGYHELADAAEQRARFEGEIRRRRASGRETPPVDERLLAALEAGLPDCAGVAVGVERLAMALFGFDRIDDALAFDVERA